MAGFFATDGRLNRGRFAIQYLAFVLPASLFAGLSNASQGQLWPFDLIAFGIMLFTIFPIIKRFHDLGHSGWWSLTTMIPLVALVPITYLLFWRGTAGTNQFGFDPLDTAKDISPRTRPVEPAKSPRNVSGPQSITPQPTSPIPANLPSVSMSPSHTNTPAAMSQDLHVIDEEAIYEQVANEIESGNVRKGLWTRLFAELDGDESKVKLAYIKTRVSQLITERQEEHWEAAEGDARRQLEIEQKRQQAAAISEQNRLREIGVLVRRLESGEPGDSDELIRLLELMGARFEWAEPGYSEMCRVRYRDQYREFTDGRVMCRWVNESVLPDARTLLGREYRHADGEADAKSDEARVNKVKSVLWRLERLDSIENRIDLIEAMGGSFTRDPGIFATGGVVSFNGAKYEFVNGKHFSSWFQETLLPQALALVKGNRINETH